MELTLDELKAVSHYFNKQAGLPGDVQVVADKMKEILNPTETVEPAKKVTKKK